MRGLAPPLAWWPLLALACSTPLAPPPHAGFGRAGPERAEVQVRPDGRVRVRFPTGSCVTGWIEVQEFERGSGTWLPHAQGSLVRAGTCRLEDAARLLNEIRVRCVDPGGARPPSPWVVGVDLEAAPADPGACPVAPTSEVH